MSGELLPYVVGASAGAGGMLGIFCLADQLTELYYRVREKTEQRSAAEIYSNLDTFGKATALAVVSGMITIGALGGIEIAKYYFNQ